MENWTLGVYSKKHDILLCVVRIIVNFQFHSCTHTDTCVMYHMYILYSWEVVHDYVSTTNLNCFPLCSQKKQLSLVGPPATSQEDDFGVLQQLEIGEQVSHKTCIHVYTIIVVCSGTNVAWSPVFQCCTCTLG